MLISSKAYREWELEQLHRLHGNKLHVPSNTKLQISCEFFLPDMRRRDLSNMFESVADMLVKAQVIDDDNAFVLSSVHLYFISIDRENPRCLVRINWED